MGESKVGYNIGPHWCVAKLSFLHFDFLFCSHSIAPYNVAKEKVEFSRDVGPVDLK